MGMYSDWVARNSYTSDKQVANVEFVLKKIDDINIGNTGITLTNADESSILPSTGSLSTVLQVIRNNLKYLFNKPTYQSGTTTTGSYVKFTQGLIIQWGREEKNINSSGVQVTFPLAFTQIPCVFKTLVTASGNGSGAYSYYSVWSITTTGFRWNNPGCPQNGIAIGV